MAMLFKTAGLILLFLIPTHIGCFKAAVLKKRAARLETLCGCMRELKSRLRSECTERSRLIGEAFSGKGTLIFNNGEIKAADDGLAPEDKIKLEAFLKEFGSGDAGTEEKRTELYISLFSEALMQARKAEAEQGKLYRTAGICTGAVICILLI